MWSYVLEIGIRAAYRGVAPASMRKGDVVAILRLILWIPIVFGAIMGGLALAKLISEGVGIGLVSAPGEIIEAYERVANAIEYCLIEIPFGIILPIWLRDFLIIWIIFSGSNMRYIFRLKGRNGFILRNVVWAPIRKHGYKFLKKTGVKTIGGIYLFLSGPIGTFQILYFSIDAFLYFRNTEQNKLTEVAARHHIRMAVIFLAIVLANPTVAAGLLWWNAAEIERLTAGIV